MQYKKLWIALGLIMFVSFSVLGGVGYKAINNAPPIPAKVVTTDGQLLFTGDTIRDGQNVWQSTGGQEIGTIWGHGAYVAPDWSADYLARVRSVANGYLSVDLGDDVELSMRLGAVAPGNRAA